MIFVLHKRDRVRQSDLQGASGAFLAVRVEEWTWDYRQGTKDKPGDVIFAESPHVYGDERTCRSAIAATRKAFGGARMAKVVAGDSLTKASDA